MQRTVTVHSVATFDQHGMLFRPAAKLAKLNET